MGTLRQDIDAKIDALKVQITELETEKSNLETEFGIWIDKEETELKSFCDRMIEKFKWNSQA